MTTMTANDSMKAALKTQTGLTELRGADGDLLGYFLPPMPADKLHIYLRMVADFDPKEAARRDAELGPRCTIGEVLAELEAKAPI